PQPVDQVTPQRRVRDVAQQRRHLLPPPQRRQRHRRVGLLPHLSQPPLRIGLRVGLRRQHLLQGNESIGNPLRVSSVNRGDRAPLGCPASFLHQQGGQRGQQVTTHRPQRLRPLADHEGILRYQSRRHVAVHLLPAVIVLRVVRQGTRRSQTL